MQFKIKLVPQPGDKSVERAEVVTVSASGGETSPKIILEGEKIDTDVTLLDGQTIHVRALERPLVYDREQHAAIPMDLTPNDPITGRPVSEPHTQGELPKIPPDQMYQSPQPDPTKTMTDAERKEQDKKDAEKREREMHPKPGDDHTKPGEPAKTDIHGKDKTPQSGTIDTSGKTPASGAAGKPHDNMTPPNLKK